MSNVVTIKRNTLLSDYSDSQKTKGAPEPVIFFGGVFLWMVLPELGYADAGGPIWPSAFAILAFVGIIGGVISYLYPAPRPLSIIESGSVRRSPRTSEPPQRKAA